MDVSIQSCRFGARRTAQSSGFTLVELLVVIGIISLLIAVLLPALNAVRGHAAMVNCSSNMRNIASAALMHSNEHQGYLPLAGELVVGPVLGAPGNERFPAVFGDSNRRRYTYTSVPGNGPFVPAPLTAALAQYMGIRDLPFEDWARLDEALNARHIQRLFVCPSTDSLNKDRTTSDNGREQGLVFALTPAINSTTPGWNASVYTDYAYNEGLLGFHHDPLYKTRRLRGQLVGLKRSAEVALITDAKLRTKPGYESLDTQKGAWISWTPAIESTGIVSLADAYEENPLYVTPGQKEMFDLMRHGGRINVAFADGHVDSFNILKDSTKVNEQLRHVYLLPQ